MEFTDRIETLLLENTGEGTFAEYGAFNGLETLWKVPLAQ